MYKKTTLLIMLFSIALFSCYVPKISLTWKEKSFGDSLAQRYHCEINMQHDYESVHNNKKNGVFCISLRDDHYNLCENDSIFLKKLSSDIARQFFTVLSHKENYASIEVDFSKYSYPDSRSQAELCSKYLTVSIRDFNNVRISGWQQHTSYMAN